jgi:N-acetylmuramoyl-L-alanine amidase
MSKRIFMAILVIALIFTARQSARFVSTVGENVITVFKEKNADVTIAIDAGHGGIDPGKVGINDALEKDINLAIAIKLERNLTQNGINVVMTRTSDDGLYEENDSNKKVTDMKKRLEIIESANPLLAVSIHQNSYPEPSVSGVQVFYYKDSIRSKEAATIMQAQMIKTLNPEKEREAKENGSYYLLKKTSVPIMIVECAFMSNPTEADLLTKEAYQEKVAWAVYMGIMEYVNSQL